MKNLSNGDNLELIRSCSFILNCSIGCNFRSYSFWYCISLLLSKSAFALGFGLRNFLPLDVVVIFLVPGVWKDCKYLPRSYNSSLSCRNLLICLFISLLALNCLRSSSSSSVFFSLNRSLCLVIMGRIDDASSLGPLFVPLSLDCNDTILPLRPPLDLPPIRLVNPEIILPLSLNPQPCEPDSWTLARSFSNFSFNCLNDWISSSERCNFIFNSSTALVKSLCSALNRANS